jgi:hypothetical protein
MVVVRDCEWQYRARYDRLKIGKKWRTKSSKCDNVAYKEASSSGEWQWLGGSGAVGKRRARRVEWWWLEIVSGRIGRVAVD